MSATRFAPEALEIVDDGSAPIFFIDGVGKHEVREGVVRVALCVHHPAYRLVVVKLFYTSETQMMMRRQLVAHLGEDLKPSDIVGAHH